MKRDTGKTAVRGLMGGIAALAIGMCLSPALAQASTSGGATIYNTVKVTYQSGTGPVRFTSANVSVTVTTIPAAPTVTNPSPQTVIAGGTPIYNYIVKSNANGLDTYTTSALADAPTNVAAATAESVTGSVQLWAGIVLGSGNGTITVPFGSTTGLVAGTSTVQIGASTYTVTTITPGTAASTDASGNLVAEVPATLDLTLISGTAVTAGSVAAGTQVGEYKTVTEQLTAGSPSIVGTDGTYSTTFTITTTATPVATLTTTAVITTVSSPKATIAKVADKLTAKPGEVITYTITVTNTHTTASVSNVTIIDPVPAYTSYVPNSTRLNTITVAGDGAVSPLAAGMAVDSNNSRAAGAAASGTVSASGVATITYQVQIN